MTTTVFVDYYQLLEVQPSASREQIKAAYRACMVRDHVDQNSGSELAQERMILLSRAKTTLLDDQRRSSYDRDRARWLMASQLGVAAPRWDGGRAPEHEFGHGPRQSVEVDLRDVSISRLLVGVGVAAVVTGFGLAARVVAERANRRRRRARAS